VVNFTKSDGEWKTEDTDQSLEDIVGLINLGVLTFTRREQLDHESYEITVIQT